MATSGSSCTAPAAGSGGPWRSTSHEAHVRDPMPGDGGAGHRLPGGRAVLARAATVRTPHRRLRRLPRLPGADAPDPARAGTARRGDHLARGTRRAAARLPGLECGGALTQLSRLAGAIRPYGGT